MGLCYGSKTVRLSEKNRTAINFSNTWGTILVWYLWYLDKLCYLLWYLLWYPWRHAGTAVVLFSLQCVYCFHLRTKGEEEEEEEEEEVEFMQLPKQLTKQMSTQMPKQMPKQLPKQLPKQMPKQMPKQLIT